MRLRSSWEVRRSWADGRGLPKAVSHAAFVGDIARETAMVDRRVRATIRSDTKRRRIPFPCFRFFDSWQQVRARFCFDEDAQPCVEVGIGTILAIDDLVLFAARMDSFLVPSRAAFDIAPAGANYRLANPFRSDGAYTARQGRFFDYRPGFLNGLLDADQISFALPMEDWRLYQACVVADLAIAWVLFHEYAHWALAHIDLLDDAAARIGLLESTGREVPAFDLGQNLTRPRGVRNHELSQVLEVHADTAAFHLLASYARRKTGPVAQFNAKMDDTPRAADPQCLSVIDKPQIVRLCLTAAAIACIAIDGHQGGRRAARASHPSPAARFINLQSQAPAAVPGLLRVVDGAFIVQDDADAAFTVARLGEMMALAVNDVQLVAGITALARDRRGRGTARDPRNWHRTAWREDMRKQWHTGAESGPETTVAGRELARIPLDDPAVNGLLQRIQLQRFGSIFDVFV